MPTLKTTSANIRPPALPGDVGYNLCACETIVIKPGAFAVVPTGVHVQIPDGFFAQILPRSSANMGGRLIVLTGVIDTGYRGELKALVHNVSHDQPAVIQAGQSVAQLVLFASITFPLELVDALDESPRGHNGFGSTGH